MHFASPKLNHIGSQTVFCVCPSHWQQYSQGYAEATSQFCIELAKPPWAFLQKHKTFPHSGHEQAKSLPRQHVRVWRVCVLVSRAHSCSLKSSNNGALWPNKNPMDPRSGFKWWKGCIYIGPFYLNGQSALQCSLSFTHTHWWRRSCHAGRWPAHGKLLGFQYLAQGHFTWTGGLKPFRCITRTSLSSASH